MAYRVSFLAPAHHDVICDSAFRLHHLDLAKLPLPFAMIMHMPTCRHARMNFNLCLMKWIITLDIILCCLYGIDRLVQASAPQVAVFVESFSLHHPANNIGRPIKHVHQHSSGALFGRMRLDLSKSNVNARGKSAQHIHIPSATSTSPENSTSTTTNTKTLTNVVDEAQLLLACRAYLLRKHKVEWKQKKRRAEAAASPLNNEGYFWPDPNDLLYLREDPDPYNLEYNETYGEYYGYKRNGVRFLASQDTTYSGKNYLEDESIEPGIERASTSANPFSTNPLYPSEEHVRRSDAKLKLWNNSTWKKEWYRRRWEGKVASNNERVRGKQEKMMRKIPNAVLESPTFDDMSEDEVAEAIITYLSSNQRKSESRKSNKDKRRIEREAFRRWREEVKQEARKSKVRNDQNRTVEVTMKDMAQKVIPPSSEDDPLSFSPSVESMKDIKAKRSEKSRIAFQTRRANSKQAQSSSTLKKVKLTKMRRNDENSADEVHYTDLLMMMNAEEISPVQALLHIDFDLDHKRNPNPTDVKTILKPGRLGRRRDTLRRILSVCFDLRGKCVPPLHSSDDSEDLLFVTNCKIDDLGAFVLTKLRSEQ